MNKVTKQKISLGDVFAIPVPDGRFAYGKIFRDGEYGVYDFLTADIATVQEVLKHPIAFYMVGTDSAIKKGVWPIIGFDAFASDDDAWAPAKAAFYLRETNEWTMGGTPRVVDKGQTRVATFDEVKGLDILMVQPKPEYLVEIIVTRLINGNHADYKVVG
jgi:Immunity protein 26